MYEYQFVRIDLRGFIENKPVQDYHEAVHEQALQGWRLLQIFAPNTQGFGTANYFELVFEREAQAK